jgi:AcrR family transcriptional regulator
MINVKSVDDRRVYRMVARAEAAEATGARILDAAIELFWHRPTDQISLSEVARHADVSTQTVIRHFGTKDGLLAAAAEREAERVRRQRDAAPVGDIEAAVRVLVDHYDELGDQVLKLLAEEDRVPGLRVIADRGRRLHREWCVRVFGPALARRRGRSRDRLLAQLVAVCDVYMWKLLRRDAGLSRPDTEQSLVEMLRPLVEER